MSIIGKFWTLKLPRFRGHRTILCSRSPRWARQDEPTRPSSIARWSIWCVPAARGEVDADELYEALDRLQAAQPEIEQALAKRHLKDGVLVLYDISSSYLEGEHCELAQRGDSRDHRPDRPQIVDGLLCNQQGCPVAVEVFEGNVADPMTLATQITKLRTRFNLSRLVLVGDRGMITDARLEADVKPAGLDWITALRAPSIRDLAAEGGPLQLSLFDQ
ncbi:MAG TPA: IS1634 family transposase, partial [Acetobacteraceae bacterium]|nr:IS1634 family transposase [Acetobacteraceae bacterium]